MPTQRALRLCGRILAGVAVALHLGFPVGPTAAQEALWAALRAGGHVALLRHAIAPGTGDPERFRLDDCETQRNLSARGRRQAERIGERFRQNGIARAALHSSQWCRCKDTAALLSLGPVSELPALNSFFQRWDRREPQTRALRDWIAARDLSAPHVLVTHQVNITALSGVTPGSGELVIARVDDGGALFVIGSIETE